MNSLAQTQRERIRQQDEQDNLEREEKTKKTKAEDVHLTIEKYKEKEEKVYFLPKCFLFLLAVLALLAAVVVLVYYFRDKTSVDGLRGTVTKDKKPVDECHDISVELGDTIVIKCNYSDPISEEVVAIYKNIAGAKTSDFECVLSNDDKVVTCTAKNETTCSSHGEVEIRFLDRGNNGKKVKFTKTVGVNVTDANSSIMTSIKQMYVGNSSEMQFNLTCQYTGSCLNHVMKFDGNKRDIDDARECTTTYSDNDGYKITCNALLSSQVFFNHSNGSALNCQLMYGDNKIKEKEFLLPSCSNIDNKGNCQPNNKTLYDCDDPPSWFDNCTNVYNVIKECYSSRVMEYSTNSSSSSIECTLGWCRHDDTKEIDTRGKLSVERLCQIPS